MKYDLPTALAILAFALTSYAQTAPIQATVLEFTPDGKNLFVADSDGGRIHAYELPEAAKATASQGYNVLDFGDKVSRLLGVQRDALTFHDLAIHPQSTHAYVSLTARKEGKSLPLIVIAKQDGRVGTIDLAPLESTSVQLTDTPKDGVTFWRDIPASTFTVTDLDHHDGTLFVSGLTNGEFASTLRKIAYPFKPDGVEQVAGIEMYHTVHDQTETRAPIRAMTIMNLGGAETVVAAYTCTPLVTLPVASLTDGAKVKAKTVAELGYGNTPLEVIDFTATDMQGKSEAFVLVVNRERSANLINVKDLKAANAADGLTKPEMWAHAGVKFRPIPLGAVMQADDQDGQYLAALRRNLDTGIVELISFRKGAYFRLSNFVSEYNFKNYKYADPKQEPYRHFQNLLKTDEGFPELAREAEPRK